MKFKIKFPPGPYPTENHLLTADGKVIENDTDLVLYFLESHGVACVQGAAYGMSPFFRVSYAASEDELRDACERIQRACAELT